uniref:Uncharacterized protein n=1 Tax=Romanomermis culicivorax TaxID=13658 RepID=A0A915L581_ROMCU
MAEQGARDMEQAMRANLAVEQVEAKTAARGIVTDKCPFVEKVLKCCLDTRIFKNSADLYLNGVQKLLRVDGPSTTVRKLKKSLCELDIGTEFDFFGSLPIAVDRKLLSEGFMGDDKAVTLVANVIIGCYLQALKKTRL